MPLCSVDPITCHSVMSIRLRDTLQWMSPEIPERKSEFVSTSCLKNKSFPKFPLKRFLGSMSATSKVLFYVVRTFLKFLLGECRVPKPPSKTDLVTLLSITYQMAQITFSSCWLGILPIGTNLIIFTQRFASHLLLGVVQPTFSANSEFWDSSNDNLVTC